MILEYIWKYSHTRQHCMNSGQTHPDEPLNQVCFIVRGGKRSISKGMGSLIYSRYLLWAGDGRNSSCGYERLDSQDQLLTTKSQER